MLHLFTSSGCKLVQDRHMAFIPAAKLLPVYAFLKVLADEERSLFTIFRYFCCCSVKTSVGFGPALPLLPTNCLGCMVDLLYDVLLRSIWRDFYCTRWRFERRTPPKGTFAYLILNIPISFSFGPSLSPSKSLYIASPDLYFFSIFLLCFRQWHGCQGVLNLPPLSFLSSP